LLAVCGPLFTYQKWCNLRLEGGQFSASNLIVKWGISTMQIMVMLLGAVGVLYVASIAFAQRVYVGFDKNDYPGDSLLPALRESFRYTSYWLNNPPGLDHNPWIGKRSLIEQNVFGFLVLFNGRLHNELQAKDAAALGKKDGGAAVDSAIREGFPRDIRILLDQEEGGRLLPDQAAYIFAWIDAVRRRGARTGVYCSAIDVAEGHSQINTAENILQLEREKAKSEGLPQTPSDLKLWVANDQCPPAPGCTLANLQPSSGARLIDPHQIAVWQYAQSPRRPQFSAGCPKSAAPDGNCYAPQLPHNPASFIDLNVATSPNPSEQH
jgi:hypothetical protein